MYFGWFPKVRYRYKYLKQLNKYIYFQMNRYRIYNWILVGPSTILLTLGFICALELNTLPYSEFAIIFPFYSYFSKSKDYLAFKIMEKLSRP